MEVVRPIPDVHCYSGVDDRCCVDCVSLLRLSLRLENQVRMYKHVLKVTVPRHKRFPVDMLRYDRCWPLTESDSVAITSSLGPDSENEIIYVATLYSGCVYGWTIPRWSSFGVTAEPTNTMQVI